MCHVLKRFFDWLRIDSVLGLLLSELSALRAYHIDNNFPDAVFDLYAKHFRRMIDGARRLQPPRQKRDRRPIWRASIITLSDGVLPPRPVDISLWAFEQDQWRQADCLTVDPLGPSPVEHVARKYTQKNWSLYNQNLQSLSPAQSFCTATADGNNAIFLISEEAKTKLTAEGRLIRDRQLLSSVSRVLGPVTSKRQPLVKRHRL
jgi:hypothetical protein